MRNVKVAAADWICVLGIVLKRLKIPIFNAGDTFLILMEDIFELSGCCCLPNRKFFFLRLWNFANIFDGHS